MRAATKRARVESKRELADRVSGGIDTRWYEDRGCFCSWCWDPELTAGPDRVLVYSRDGKWGVAMRLGVEVLPIPPTLRFRLARVTDL